MLEEAMMDRPRWSLLKNALPSDNFGLNFVRQTKSPSWQHGVVSKFPAPAVFVEIKDGSNFAPLYVQEEIDETRRGNFDAKLWRKLRAKAKDAEHGEPDEVATFDYIYGVLHCPAYRETYAEFLKIDFPRIPWPASPAEFWDIAAKGGELRRLHLMQPPAIGPTPYPYTGDGDDVVDKPRLDGSRIWINDTQGFDAMPPAAWDFWIGGYQPAQKWLKDRKGRALSFEDIQHYQHILKILSETDRIMATITMTLGTESADKEGQAEC
jgi:predicted helicase